MSGVADYQAWRRTPGGRVHAMQYPSEAEAIGEVQRTADVTAIRDVQDRHELVYGRRLSVTEARAALEHGWERGQGFTGTAAQLQTVTQGMFPGEFVVRNLGKLLDDRLRTGADLVHPVTSVAGQGPAGVAGL